MCPESARVGSLTDGQLAVLPYIAGVFMKRHSVTAIVFNGGALMLALALSLDVTAAPATASGKLTFTTQQQLQASRDKQQARVTLLVAAFPGQSAAAASALISLGAKVLYREDSLDYLRVLIDTSRVEAAAALPSVRYVDLDEVLKLPNPRPDAFAGGVLQPSPSATTPLANPYLPTQDTKAAQFVTANPSFDGRGVTIAIIDSGVTLDHPALQTTSTGERKIVDWVTYTDPFTENDPTWLNMSAQVNGARFMFQAVQYTAPYAGSFRIAGRSRGVVRSMWSWAATPGTSSSNGRSGIPPGPTSVSTGSSR